MRNSIVAHRTRSRRAQSHNNANMRNSIVAHRTQSRRAQSHKAQSHKVRSRRVQPHTRRHTGREGGRRRRSRAIAFTIEVGPTTKLHEHTEDTARAGKRAQGGHVHRWRDVRAQRKHARGAHRPQACARTRTTHCCRVLGAALELAPPPAAAQDAHPTQTDMPDPPDPASPRDALPAPRFPPRSAHPWLCAPAFPAAAPCGMGRGSTARQAVPALQWCVSRRPAARSAAASRGPSLEGPHRHARPPHHLRKDGCLQPRL